MKPISNHRDNFTLNTFFLLFVASKWNFFLYSYPSDVNIKHFIAFYSMYISICVYAYLHLLNSFVRLDVFFESCADAKDNENALNTMESTTNAEDYPFCVLYEMNTEFVCDVASGFFFLFFFFYVFSLTFNKFFVLSIRWRRFFYLLFHLHCRLSMHLLMWIHFQFVDVAL